MVDKKIDRASRIAARPGFEYLARDLAGYIAGTLGTHLARVLSGNVDDTIDGIAPRLASSGHEEAVSSYTSYGIPGTLQI